MSFKSSVADVTARMQRASAGRLTQVAMVGILAAGVGAGGWFLLALSRASPSIVGTVDGVRGPQPGEVAVAEAVPHVREAVNPFAVPPTPILVPRPQAAEAGFHDPRTVPPHVTSPPGRNFEPPRLTTEPPRTAPAPVVAAVTPPPVSSSSAQPAALSQTEACAPPQVTAEPADGGMMQIAITAPCRGGQTVKVLYADIAIVRRLDPSGALKLSLDLFAGAERPVDILFADNTRRSLTAAARDLNRITKVAVIWRSPVNLDLHAFEYAAPFGDTGHLWAKAQRSAAVATAAATLGERSHGFVSSVADGTGTGDQFEVYTLFHSDKQSGGSIAMALDFESRGDVPSGETCGSGTLARVDYEFRVLSPNGRTTVGSGVILPAACGARLTPDIRYQHAGMPTLRPRKP